MIVVKTFVSELSKKIEMLHAQIDVFEKKVSQVKLIEEIIKKSTLKDFGEINGDDLALISEDNYQKIIEIVMFNDNEDNMKKFVEHAVNNRLYAKLLLDGKIDEELIKKNEISKIWLENQASHIKEFIIEFKLSNENYLNNLKQSDNLYQKYLMYFDNDELVVPITNVDEFNDLLRKSGLIVSEKWQLLKYVAQKNILLSQKQNKNDVLEEIKLFLDKESNLLENMTEEQLEFCMSLIDMEDSKLKSLNLSNEELIKYQKISILYSIKDLYEETIASKDKKTIDKNKKELIDFKNSYLFFDKLK